MNPVILITGATDGIGLTLARLYAKSAARLILVGRRSLQKLGIGKVERGRSHKKKEHRLSLTVELS